MKRPLNLNPHTGRILALLGLLLIAVPGLLWLLSRALTAAGHAPSGLLHLARGSFIAGLACLGVFALLVIVEQVQDRLYDRGYRRQRGRKLAGPGGMYECQYCGNRQLTERDRRCTVCGRELH